MWDAFAKDLEYTYYHDLAPVAARQSIHAITGCAQTLVSAKAGRYGLQCIGELVLTS